MDTFITYCIECCGRDNHVQEHQAEDLVKGLLSLRSVSRELLKYHQKVIDDVVKYPIQSDTVYYPCDIVELRQIFVNNTIFNTAQVCLFSYGFAKKYFSDYAVLIGIKSSDIQDKIGGVSLCGNRFTPVKDKVCRVFVNEKLTEKQIMDINGIVEDECPNLDMDVIGNIPSLDEPIFALKKFNMLKVSQKNVSSNIQLTPNESKIFDFLVSCKGLPALNGVEFRVAGGWVRDKLLGVESDDIDIAVSSMSGIKVAELISLAGKQQHQNAVGSPYSVSLEKTTDKSKQSDELMVGGIKIFGIKIEFVPMRTETYSRDSRTPQVVRTDDPREDAFRRDLTINGLYYNIETRQVEDYVGGIQDLQTMTLRTPLSPEKTFQDDPLRMLRVLRFFSRFEDSKLDPSVHKALLDPKVQEFYGPPKLAPERASTEFIKMMSGAKPADAIKILFDSGLYKRVLNTDENMNDIHMDQQNPNHKHTVGDHIVSVIRNANEMSKQNNVPPNERGLLNLSAFFHDFGKLDPDIQTEHPNKPGQMQYLGHEDRSENFATEVMTRMGFDKDVKKFVSTVVRHHMWPFMMDRGMKQKKVDKHTGKFLREVGDLYDKIILHSQADRLGKSELEPDERQQIIEETQSEIDRVTQYRQDLGQRINKTIIDGNRIREILNEIVPELVTNNAFIVVGGKPTHYLGYAANKMIEAQWMRRINTIEEAEAFVRDQAKNWLHMWQQQQNDPNKEAFSFNMSKFSNLDSYTGDTNQFSNSTQWEGVTYMDRSVISPFAIGDKIRLRTQGIGYTHIKGRVKKIDNNTMTVELLTGKNKGKDILVDLIDAASLSMKWEKYQ